MRRAVPTTVAPVARNRCVTNVPSPPLAPVISTTLSFTVARPQKVCVTTGLEHSPPVGQPFPVVLRAATHKLSFPHQYCTNPRDSLSLYRRCPGGGMADAEDLKSSGDFSSWGF